MRYNYKYFTCYFMLWLILSSCKKLVSIPPAVGFVTTAQVFSNDGEATSAAAGMYYKLCSSGNNNFGSAGTTIFLGLSADELNIFNLTNTNSASFQFNALVSTNTIVSSNFWQNAYSVIYSANAVIDGLQGYAGVHDSLKNELIGEAEFVRAFCHFY